MGEYKFIVLEGLDRSGKTTVAKILAEKLAPSTVICFPDRSTPVGQIIDSFLKKSGMKMPPETLHLLYSANRYEKTDEIRKALKTSNVISDRYWMSGSAYSAASGLDLEWCIAADHMLPKPDYAFFLDIDEEGVAKRPNFGSEFFEKKAFQKKVYNCYKNKRLAESMISIPADRDIDSIVEDIIEIING